MTIMNKTFITILTSLTILISAMAFDSYAETKINAENIYKMYCWQCHGMSGNGKGVNTPYMNVQPRDHSSKKEMGHLPDKQLRKAITHGGLAVAKSVEMPPWGHTLSEVEVNALVEYLHKVCNCNGSKK